MENTKYDMCDLSMNKPTRGHIRAAKRQSLCNNPLTRWALRWDGAGQISLHPLCGLELISCEMSSRTPRACDLIDSVYLLHLHLRTVLEPVFKLPHLNARFKLHCFCQTHEETCRQNSIQTDAVVITTVCIDH